jgi:S1-C subfamily serine protease
MADRAAAQSAGAGYGAYLGSIPDMTSNPGGVRLMGIRKDSPADLGGLRAGDIITRIGPQPVPDLQAMTNALRSFKPGDAAEIKVLREGRELTLKVTFGRRD